MNVAHSLPLPAIRADRRRSYTAIWLALAFALLLHVFFILMPFINQAEQARPQSTSIEIQVTRFPPEPVTATPPVAPPATFPDAPMEQKAEPAQSPVKAPLPQTANELPANPEIVPENSAALIPNEQVKKTSEQRLQRLSPGILSSQFIRQESAADKIFGPSYQADPQPVQKAFHFPQQANMITMLDRPIVDLPFQYTPGLIEFAYDPGLKGDVQRFWDKITPEFGWRTNYGTQIKCKWILVIAACGWGRSGE